MKINKRYLSLIFVVVLNLVSVVPVFAHSPIEKVSPQANGLLEKPPSTVDIWFEDPVEVYVGSVTVQNQKKQEFQIGKPTLTEGKRHVSVALSKDLPPGKYTVKIDVVGLDGHAIQDTYEFDVKEPQLTKEEMFQKLKLDHSFPEDGTILTTYPKKIEIWLTQPAQLPVFVLLDDHQQMVSTSKPYVDPKDPKHFIMDLGTELKPGTYSVNWQAEIGDKAKYEIFYFAVNKVSSIVGAASWPVKPLLSYIGLNQIGHWLAFLGILALTGGTWFLLMIARARGNLLRWKKVSYFLYGLSMAGFLIEIIANRIEFLQASTKDFIAFTFVWIPLLQMLLLSLGYWLVRGKLRLALLSLSVILWAFTGHAASPGYGGIWGTVIDMAHLLAVSVWMGGLLALFVMMPKETPVTWLKEAGKDYSKWALFSSIVIGFTGVWMAIKYVPSFTVSSIAESYWGQMLFIKIILFIGIIVLGFFQRKSLQRIAQHVIPFVTRIKIELVVAVIILLAAAILIDLSPKEAEQGIYPKKVIQNGVEARVEISPFQLGANDITISFQNEPEFKTVRVKLWAAPSWSVENTAFPLGDGKYRLTGNFLHGAGAMNLEVEATKINGETMVFPFKVQVPGVQDTDSE